MIFFFFFGCFVGLVFFVTPCLRLRRRPRHNLIATTSVFLFFLFLFAIRQQIFDQLLVLVLVVFLLVGGVRIVRFGFTHVGHLTLAHLRRVRVTTVIRHVLHRQILDHRYARRRLFFDAFDAFVRRLYKLLGLGSRGVSRLFRAFGLGCSLNLSYALDHRRTDFSDEIIGFVLDLPNFFFTLGSHGGVSAGQTLHRRLSAHAHTRLGHVSMASFRGASACVFASFVSTRGAPLRRPFVFAQARLGLRRLLRLPSLDRILHHRLRVFRLLLRERHQNLIHLFFAFRLHPSLVRRAFTIRPRARLSSSRHHLRPIRRESLPQARTARRHRRLRPRTRRHRVRRDARERRASAQRQRRRPRPSPSLASLSRAFRRVRRAVRRVVIAKSALDVFASRQQRRALTARHLLAAVFEGC